MGLRLGGRHTCPCTHARVCALRMGYQGVGLGVRGVAQAQEGGRGAEITLLSDGSCTLRVCKRLRLRSWARRTLRGTEGGASPALALKSSTSVSISATRQASTLNIPRTCAQHGGPPAGALRA